jgi:hypothetical protein
MRDPDAILLAAFDDEPLPFSGFAPGLRPADRPRPRSSSQPPTDPIDLVVVESNAEPDSTAGPATARSRPTLAVDIGLLDPTTASFLVVYPAGTPLEALGPRTVSVPAQNAGSKLTRLALSVRTPGQTQPSPYLTLEWPQDIGGQHLTLRFTDPAELRSLIIRWDPGLPTNDHVATPQ